MYIENSIVIKEDIDKVFQVMADVERWHEFMSHYKRKVKILDKEDNKILIERDAIIKWKVYLIIDKEKRIIIALHLSGITKGLVAIWRFEEVPEGTKMTLHHAFIPKVPLLGNLKWLLIKKGIEKMGRLITAQFSVKSCG